MASRVREVTGWTLRRPESLDADEQVRIKQVLAHCPQLEAAATYVTAFAQMMAGRRGEPFDDRLTAVEASGSWAGQLGGFVGPSRRAPSPDGAVAVPSGVTSLGGQPNSRPSYTVIVCARRSQPSRNCLSSTRTAVDHVTAIPAAFVSENGSSDAGVRSRWA